MAPHTRRAWHERGRMQGAILEHEQIYHVGHRLCRLLHTRHGHMHCLLQDMAQDQKATSGAEETHAGRDVHQGRECK